MSFPYNPTTSTPYKSRDASALGTDTSYPILSSNLNYTHPKHISFTPQSTQLPTTFPGVSLGATLVSLATSTKMALESSSLIAVFQASLLSQVTNI